MALDHGDVKTLALPDMLGARGLHSGFLLCPSLLRQIEAVAAKLVVLDHHLSAAEKLTGFSAAVVWCTLTWASRARAWPGSFSPAAAGA